MTNPLITVDPAVRFGKPCIAGTRISADDIREYLANGMSQEQILAAFPQLKPEHIQAALDYPGLTFHAVFSEQAANTFGSSIYLNPDGKEVEVTNVYSSEENDNYNWVDKVYVGEVKTWLRQGRSPLSGECWWDDTLP